MDTIKSAVTVSPTLGRIIEVLSRQLSTEFGTDVAFSISIPGKTLAASNAVDGVITPNFDDTKKGIVIYTGVLTLLRSIPDRAGNVYGAFRFFDYATGKTIQAIVSAADNVYGVLRHWNVKDGWDRSVLYNEQTMGYREFKRETKDWPYAGCNPEDLATYIKKALAE